VRCWAQCGPPATGVSSIREHGGEPSSRLVDELLDERLQISASSVRRTVDVSAAAAHLRRNTPTADCRLPTADPVSLPHQIRKMSD
jgi:hypothetical protein